jgi:DNA polymerase-1
VSTSTAKTSATATPQTAGKLLLLDGHSLAYRAFFALPVENFSTSTGQPTNAVYGFTSMLINVLRDEKPTHIIVAFDVSRQSFRTERYAEYKAGRATTPTDFAGQVALIKEVLAALRLPVVEAPGYEADDAIATLARDGRAAGLEVLICSGDRDAFQLVDDHVTVLYPRKGVSDLARMTPATVEEKYGVPPGQYRDLAALVGESSDNLPGIAGVGPKTAAKWITTYGGLEGVVAHVDEIKGKAGDSLRAGLADVLRNYELNRLVDDLDLSVAAADTQWRGWDREQVHQVFDALQFRVLRDRLYQYLEAVEPEAEGGFDLDTAVLGAGAVAPWLAAHVIAGEPVGLAVTGAFGRGAGSLSAVAIATSTGHAAWFDPAGLDAADEVAVAAWWSDPDRPKIIHDSKPALLAAMGHGWTLRGVARDTALAAYLARPDQRSYDLTDLALRYLHRGLKVDSPDNGQLTLDGLGGDSDVERNLMLRAAATLDLADAIGAELARDGDTSAGLLADVEQPLVEVLARMERTGIAADNDYLSNLEAHFAAGVKDAVIQIKKGQKIIGDGELITAFRRAPTTCSVVSVSETITPVRRSSSRMGSQEIVR